MLFIGYIGRVLKYYMFVEVSKVGFIGFFFGGVYVVGYIYMY